MQTLPFTFVSIFSPLWRVLKENIYPCMCTRWGLWVTLLYLSWTALICGLFSVDRTNLESFNFWNLKNKPQILIFILRSLVMYTVISMAGNDQNHQRSKSGFSIFFYLVRSFSVIELGIWLRNKLFISMFYNLFLLYLLSPDHSNCNLTREAYVCQRVKEDFSDIKY